MGVFPDATRATRATRRERAPTPRDRHDVHGAVIGERDAVDEASRGRSSSSRRAGSGVGIAFRERVNPRLLEPRARDVRRKRRASGRGDRARGWGGRDANATHHLDGFLRTWMTPRTLRQLERATPTRARASKAGNLRSSKPKKNDLVSASKTRPVSGEPSPSRDARFSTPPIANLRQRGGGCRRSRENFRRSAAVVSSTRLRTGASSPRRISEARGGRSAHSRPHPAHVRTVPSSAQPRSASRPLARLVPSRTHPRRLDSKRI